MLANALLTTNFPTLRPEDSLREAEDIFLDYSVTHIPIVSESAKLEGILPMDILIGIPDRSQPINAFRHDWMHAFAFRDQHSLSVFEIISRLGLTAIPVVDEERTYLGVILTAELLSRLSTYYSFRENGGIIELLIGLQDYDLSAVARIIESNNAKILVLYLDVDEHNAQYRLTLKINTPDLHRILATFERFKYTVDFHYPSDRQSDELRDRYELLMKLFDL